MLGGLIFSEEWAFGNGDQWWRLAVNSGDVSQWCFRNLELFLDRNCLVAVPSLVSQRITSPYEWRDETGSTAFAGFSSNCQGALCAPLEPWVAVRYADSVVVQCLKYEDCLAATTTTTTTTTTAPTTASPSTTAASPSTTMVTTSTSTVGGPTTTTSNPFGDLFDQLEGLRRLSSPGELVLHRSADSATWEQVGAWTQPPLGGSISMDTSSYTPTSQLSAIWQPTPDFCMRCWDGGISETSTITVTFDREIYFGEGHIVIRPGGQAALTEVARSSMWFRVVDRTLQVLPSQVGATLGLANSCLRIEIKDRAILNADGNAYQHVYETCIRDYIPPAFVSSDPGSGEANVDLRPKLRLSFDEVITLASDAVATLRAKSTSGTGSLPADVILDLNQAQVFQWDRLGVADAGYIDIYITQDLEPQTQYELLILNGVIQDSAGNAWEGGSIIFTTTCSVAGCVQPSTAAPPAPATEEPGQPQQPSLAIYFVIAGIVTILCAVGVVGFQLYVRRQALSKAQVHPFDGRKEPEVERSASEATSVPKDDINKGPSVAWTGDASGPLFGDSGPSAATASRPQAHWRSKEAEDVGSSRRPAEESFPRKPQTDDNVGLGGRRDPKPDKAPPFGPKVHKEPRGHRTHATPPPPKKEEPAAPAPLSQNPEVQIILMELNGQLEGTRKEDIASRKKTFKFSCLKWHPDKNADNLEVATEVFQWLQSQRDWYLKE